MKNVWNTDLKHTYESSILVRLMILLILLYLSTVLGVIVIWSAAIGVSFIWAQQRVRRKRIEILESLLARETTDTEIRSEESQWVNTIIYKYWITCGREIEKHSPYIATALNQVLPCGLGSAKFRVQGFSLGSRPPIIERIQTHSFLPNHQIQLDIQFYWCPDHIYQLAIAAIPFIPPIPAKLSNFVMRGKARVSITFNGVHPKLTEFSIGLLSMPQIDFKISFLGQVDSLVLPGVYQWASESIQKMLAPFAWPHQAVFRLSNHAEFLPLVQRIVLSNELPPIVAVGLANVGDILPDGWELVHRSVSGMYPADLNRRSTNAAELFLCYKRKTQENETPITGICIIFPKHQEVSLSGFSQVTRTLGNNEGTLNPNSQNPAFLCYSHSPDSPAITDLQIFNKTMESLCPPHWTVLEFTPNGHRATFNKGSPESDEVYIAYAGGSKSPFGFHPKVKPDQGILKVTLISAINLAAADIGGVCDSYADMFIGYGSTGEKTTSKVNRTIVAEKTTNPKWEQTAIFRAGPADVLTILFYNVAAAKDELLGILKFPLDTLKMGTPITSWYDLQATTQGGHVLLTIEALNFGLSESCQTGRPLHQIDIGKAGKRIRKFRIAEKPLRPSISTKSSQVVASLRSSGQRRASEMVEDCTHEEISENLSESTVAAGDSAPDSQNEVHGFINRRGFLEKASGASYKKGKSKRWFVLKDEVLVMYKTPKEKNSLETLALVDAKVILEDYRLIVRNSKHKWELSAQNANEAEEWAASLRRNIGFALEATEDEFSVVRSDSATIRRSSGVSASAHRRTDSAPENITV